MPTILWLSDLHLDHATQQARSDLAAMIHGFRGSAVIVSGDTSVGPRLVPELEYLADLAARPVYFVLGNHDHYGATVGKMRDAVAAMTARRPEIQWLPPAGVVALDDSTALVGVDGWADGGYGDPLGTPLLLNDDRLIGELAAQQSRAGKLEVKRALAGADAARLETLLERGVAAARRVLVVTHVPPFPAALPTTGRLAGQDWLPLVVCKATGDRLKAAAASHPEHEFLVLCGHTHVETDVMVLPNLRCRVAGARYGEPAARSIEVF